MTERPNTHNVEINDAGQTVAAAEVTNAPGQDGATQIAFHAAAGHLPTGTRGELVDAVLDLPEVSASNRLLATVPLGDTESLNRLRERTTHMHTHAAGSTALVDADLPGPPAPAKAQAPSRHHVVL